MDCLNRRMPNGTSGGVGAGAGNRPGYPILFNHVRLEQTRPKRRAQPRAEAGSGMPETRTRLRPALLAR